MVALPFILQAIAQPNIVLTETSYIEGDCYEDYLFFFTLVSTGDADGFAKVEFLIDGVAMEDTDYFVQAGTTVEKSVAVLVDDCVQHTAEVRIASVWKA